MDSGKVSPSPAQRYERPVFAAVIHPRRSLGPGGVRTVLTLCCLAAAAASIPFVVLGVWPVAGFFGLDLLALFIAFRLNVRAARAFEEVVLTPVELMFRASAIAGGVSNGASTRFGRASTRSTTTSSGLQNWRWFRAGDTSSSPGNCRRWSARNLPRSSARRWPT
jgi:uncharacterized membrane protein